MIVFLESDKNNFTTYLNPPIKARKVRLVSCSLYNSWYNLIAGEMARIRKPRRWHDKIILILITLLLP